MSRKGDTLRAIIDPEVASAVDAVPLEVNELGFDAWGFNRQEARLYYSLAKRIYQYFRPVLYGVENIPAGRVLIVPNHSGQVPFDGLVVAVACLLYATPPRIVRAMADRWVPTIPVINELYSRAGVTVGDPINCKNLLEAENAILVFPEGTRGSGKIWKNRYKLAQFGRGFMRLALQTDSPIVPVAVVGAEESIISVYDWQGLAKLLGIPYVPISPWLPLLGPLAYLPLPTRFHVHFGAPMRFTGPFDDEDSVIDTKVAQVQDEVQRMINEGRRIRKGIF